MERPVNSLSYTNSLERKLADEPIVLPDSPFWDVFKTFGRDEMIALGINTIGTAIVSNFATNPFVLSATGPVVEKGGLFGAYFKQAWDIYRTTPKDQRENPLRYIGGAFKRGFPTLWKDLAFHDTIYTTLMYYGMQAYPQTPAWMLAMLSFGAGIGAVATGEVAVNELRYHARIHRLCKSGFRHEPYLESRFYIKDGDPQEILRDLSDKFNLGTVGRGSYHDRYFETSLKGFNLRTPTLRLRERTRAGGGQMQTLQVVYTRASEIARKKPKQFNYYPTWKDKLWLELKQEMPWEIAEIKDEKLRRLCERVTNGQHRDVIFIRDVALDPQNILISVDQVNPSGSNSFTVVEIKAYADEKRKATMIEAMRHVMFRYEVVQTTHGKRALTTVNSA